MTQALVTEVAYDVVGVRFQAGEAFSFIGLAARETRDIHLALTDVWGSLAREIEERLASARSSAERLRLLDAVLLGRLARAPSAASLRLRAAVHAIQAERGCVTTRAIAERAGLGERQLERLFDERVGVGPKVFARIVRVEAVVDALAGGPPKWSALAAALGYADQAHLVREVKQLTGVTPGELARERRAPMSDFFNTSPRSAATQA